MKKSLIIGIVMLLVGCMGEGGNCIEEIQSVENALSEQNAEDVLISHPNDKQWDVVYHANGRRFQGSGETLTAATENAMVCSSGGTYTTSGLTDIHKKIKALRLSRDAISANTWIAENLIMEDADFSTRNDPEIMVKEMLEQGKALCAGRVILMRHMLKKYKTRYVGMFGLSGFGVPCYAGHSMCEIWWDNKWHLFDPSYGVYWTNGGDILSMQDLLRGSPYTMVGGNSDIEQQMQGFLDKHLMVVYGEDERQQAQKMMSR